VYVFVLVSTCGTVAFGQRDASLTSGSSFGISGGIGISLVNTTDIVDYINERAVQQAKLDDFGLASEFFGSAAVRMNNQWGVKLEYSYLLKSYNASQTFASDVSYSYGVHMPTVIAQYLILGNGYAFKAGGGLGYHVARFTEEFSYGSTVYTSTGLGVELDAEANTEFDDHLFSYISIDVRDDIMGEFQDPAGTRMYIASRGKNAKMNLFALGLKFGLLYYF